MTDHLFTHSAIKFLDFAQSRLGKLKNSLKNSIDEHLTSLTTAESFAPFLTDIQQAYDDHWRSARCVFFLSTGRVGTETLTALLNESPLISAVHEPSPRLIYVSYQAFAGGVNGSNIDHWKNVVMAARDDYVLQANKAGKTYVETNNRLTYLAPALAAAFPSSKFIYVHRHPYDVIRSAMRRGYYINHPGDFARYRPSPTQTYGMEWEEMPLLEKAAWYWDRVNRDAINFVDSTSSQRVFTLRSSDIFSGNHETLDAIFAFAGSPMPSDEAIRRVLGQKLNKQTDGQFPPPQEWDASSLARIDRIVSETAGKLGYDL